MPTVTLIHAALAAVRPVAQEFRKLDQVRVLNQLDEALLAGIDTEDGLTPACLARMECQLQLAAEAGSDAVLTTCNAYSVLIMRDLRPRFPNLPIVVIDEPMIRRALTAERIGVVATVPAGVDSQRQMIEQVMQEEGRSPSVSYVLREQAFAALSEGRPAEHDSIVLAEIERLADRSDLVVLAQASMARVLEHVPEALRPRVLTSPPFAVAEVGRILDDLSSETAEQGGYLRQVRP